MTNITTKKYMHMNRTIMDYVCMPTVLESVSTSVRGSDNELDDIVPSTMRSIFIYRNMKYII